MAEANRLHNMCLSVALFLESLILCLLLVVCLAGEVLVFAPYGEAPYEACVIAVMICLTAYSLSKQLAA